LNDPTLHFDNRSPVDLKDRCVSFTRAISASHDTFAHDPRPPVSVLTFPMRTSNTTLTPRLTSPQKYAPPYRMAHPSSRRRVARSVARSRRKRTVHSKLGTTSTAPFGQLSSKTQFSRSRTAAPLTSVTGSATHSLISTKRLDTSHATLQRRSSSPLHAPRLTSNFTPHVRPVPLVVSDVTPPRVF
jgi:hypothetical protein